MPKFALPYKYSSELVLLDELPSGASGYVYRAQYRRDGKVQDVVVKFFDHPPSHELFGYFTNEQVVLRVLNEAYKHPHLVQYIAHNLSQPPFYLVTRYVSGAHPLHKLKPTDVTPSLLVRIVEQVATALDYMHEGKHDYKPVIHRDVKPDNILLDTTNNAVLIDLSIARHPHFSIVDEKIMGTPSYMPPEQYTGEEVPASDQFSLAAVVYELLAHQPLLPKHAQKAYQQLEELHKTDYARVRTALSGQYPEATAVLCKALALNPEDRYLTCTGFANALRDALKVDGKRVDAPIFVTSRRRAATDWRRWLMPVAAILAVFLLGGATIGAVQVLNQSGRASTSPTSTIEQMPTATLVENSSIKLAETTTTATLAAPASAATATLVPIADPVGTPFLARVTVPAVWGFNIAQARDILTSRRLNYIVVPYPDAAKENGFIGNQDPEPGLEVDAGAAITIYVVDNGGGNFESSGGTVPLITTIPIATIDQSAPLAAQQTAQAQAAAQAAQQTAAANAAIQQQQEQAAAEQAAQQTAQAAAQLVTVPAVWGGDVSVAIATLQSLGLNYVISEYGDNAYPNGHVSNVTPAPGTQVPPGTTVTLEVVQNRGGGPGGGGTD
ncbi:serine/threonine protein kinase [bacterium]|nr:serine/threonine protein kinase [bacterium]